MKCPAFRQESEICCWSIPSSCRRGWWFRRNEIPFAGRIARACSTTDRRAGELKAGTTRGNARRLSAAAEMRASSPTGRWTLNASSGPRPTEGRGIERPMRARGCFCFCVCFQAASEPRVIAVLPSVRVSRFCLQTVACVATVHAGAHLVERDTVGPV